MDESVNVENEKQGRLKPPLNIGRIAGEILAGTAAGFAVTVPAAYVTEIKLVDTKAHFVAFPFLVVFIIFLALLYGFASAVGVYLVGSIGKQTGPFLSTIGCGLFGGLVMLAMLAVSFVLSGVLILGVEKVVLWACWAFVFLIAPILATLGFNWSRRYKKPLST